MRNLLIVLMAAGMLSTGSQAQLSYVKCCQPIEIIMKFYNCMTGPGRWDNPPYPGLAFARHGSCALGFQDQGIKTMQLMDLMCSENQFLPDHSNSVCDSWRNWDLNVDLYCQADSSPGIDECMAMFDLVNPNHQDGGSGSIDLRDFQYYQAQFGTLP